MQGSPKISLKNTCGTGIELMEQSYYGASRELFCCSQSVSSVQIEGNEALGHKGSNLFCSKTMVRMPSVMDGDAGVIITCVYLLGQEYVA